jgi:1,2-dihydroxy-3-keto-5-methylthiopentene dioxygenase
MFPQRMRNMFLKSKKTFSTSNSIEAARPYSGMVQALHWSMGSAVLGCFAFVQLAQNTKDKKDKGNYMFYHKSCGTLAAGLLAPRLLLRSMSTSAGSFSNVMWEKIASQISHAAMYGFLVAMPVTGVAMGYYNGRGLPFFFTTIPGKSGATKADGKTAGWYFGWHKYLGWYMEMLTLSHVGAVGIHILKGERILARILPLSNKKI